MRLIDADALESVMDDRYSLGEIGRRERDDIVNALNYCAPSLDAVPVVRCKNCVWTKTDGMDDPAIYCRKWDRWEMPPDGFCWLGKKKEG